MIGLIKNVDPEGVITGEGAMTKDLIEVADVDFKNVNVWSIMAVLVLLSDGTKNSGWNSGQNRRKIQCAEGIIA